jgi:hypothetical protein
MLISITKGRGKAIMLDTFLHELFEAVKHKNYGIEEGCQRNIVS